MPIDDPSGQDHPRLSKTIFGNNYRLLSKMGRSRETATYRTVDKAGDEYVLIEFLNRSTNRMGIDTIAPEAWQSSTAPTPADFWSVIGRLSRLRHPNIQPIRQIFKDNETAYAVVEPYRGRKLSSDLEDQQFFHQTPEIISASKALVDVGAYLQDMGAPEFTITTDAISVDDDGVPCVLMRPCLDAILASFDASEASSDTPIYGTAASVYAMITGIDIPSRAERREIVTSGSNDPFFPIHDLDIGYRQAMRQLLDDTLRLEDPINIDAVTWAENFHAALKDVPETPVEAQAPEKRRSKLAFGGFATASAAAIAIAVTLYASDTRQDAARPNVETASLTKDLVSATDNPSEATDRNAVSEDPALEPAEPLADPSPKVVPESSDPTIDQASLPATKTPTPIPETSTQEGLEASTPAAPTTEPDAPQETADVAAIETETRAQDASQSQGDAVRKIDQADVLDLFREIGNENAADASTEDVEQSEAPATVSTANTPAQQEPTKTASDDQTEDPEEVVVAAPAPDSNLLRAAQTIGPKSVLPHASTTGNDTVWFFQTSYAYEVLADDTGAAFLRIRSKQDQFAFLARNEWFSQTSEVRSVAGIEVSDDFSLEEVLGRHFANNPEASPLVGIVVSDTGGLNHRPETLDLSIALRVRFKGEEVAQRSVNGRWELVVTTPNTAAGRLGKGDVILADARTGDALTTISALSRVVQRADQKNQKDIELLVRRSSGRERAIKIPLSELLPVGESEG